MSLLRHFLGFCGFFRFRHHKAGVNRGCRRTPLRAEISTFSRSRQRPRTKGALAHHLPQPHVRVVFISFSNQFFYIARLILSRNHARIPSPPRKMGFPPALSKWQVDGEKSLLLRPYIRRVYDRNFCYGNMLHCEQRFGSHAGTEFALHAMGRRVVATRVASAIVPH